ncbi:hypothetical protein SAMN04487894_104283 [Niabella drilacis]|uniref:Uncharacterized protein n=1 Tax=Niabella drilacis (strain DSM 25811 / CCM 8410 / CCUG 62505 / LMG 26954 / E90) TaxID=1285928 RepID=A0A1G6Q563_NIADE|nr:hypothetical protein SAMN04487894_104283 [Niabella drilacis]
MFISTILLRFPAKTAETGSHLSAFLALIKNADRKFKPFSSSNELYIPYL